MIFDSIITAQYCGFALSTGIVLILVTEVVYCWLKLYIVCSVLYNGEQDAFVYIMITLYVASLVVCCLTLISLTLCKTAIWKYLRAFLWFYMMYIICDIAFDIADLFRHKDRNEGYSGDASLLTVLITVAKFVFTTIVRLYFFVMINSYRMKHEEKRPSNRSSC